MNWPILQIFSTKSVPCECNFPDSAKPHEPKKRTNWGHPVKTIASSCLHTSCSKAMVGRFASHPSIHSLIALIVILWMKINNEYLSITGLESTTTCSNQCSKWIIWCCLYRSVTFGSIMMPQIPSWLPINTLSVNTSSFSLPGCTKPSTQQITILLKMYN